MAVALSSSSCVCFGADIIVIWGRLCPGSSVWLLFFFMVALILAIAAESAPIFFAISNAFSGESPALFIIFFIADDGASLLSAIFAVGALAGMEEPITIIFENKSFDPSTSSAIWRASSSSVTVIPATRQISSSVGSRCSASNLFTRLRAGTRYRLVNLAPLNSSPLSPFPRSLSRA